MEADPHRFTLDGRELTARPGQSVGAAMAAAGIPSWRTTRKDGRPRGLFCGIGVCYDCLVTVDGAANQRACLVPAADGMALTTEPPAPGAPAPGAPALGATPAGPPAAAPADEPFDVAVVGAGPAGLAAAVAAAESGARVVVVDAGARVGGQYWRHPAGSTAQQDAKRFDELRRRFSTGRITHLPSTQVWFVEPPARTARDDLGPATLHLVPTTACAPEIVTAPAVVTARRLVLCPGGYDRQLPIPGWDLPGVMAAGGVQALLKGHRSLAGRRTVVAGTGPFLLSVATQLADAGAEVLAVCEANGLSGWARQFGAAARVPGKIVEGVGYAAAALRHRIPYRTRTAVTRIDPDASGARAGRVWLRRIDGDGRLSEKMLPPLDVDLVALGWGFTPSMELISAVEAQTRVDVDESLVAVVDASQRSTVPGVFVAGEATGVGGALLAAAEGELAGIAAADAEERLAGRVRRLRARIARLRGFAAAMHATHPVPQRWPDWLTPATVVCRCEEVSSDAVRAACDELGAGDVRTVKLMARPGMGWCQGHVCGFATAKLAAAATGRPLTVDDLRPLAKQSLCAPVTLAGLADTL